MPNIALSEALIKERELASRLQTNPRAASADRSSCPGMWLRAHCVACGTAGRALERVNQNSTS